MAKQAAFRGSTLTGTHPLWALFPMGLSQHANHHPLSMTSRPHQRVKKIVGPIPDMVSAMPEVTEWFDLVDGLATYIALTEGTSVHPCTEPHYKATSGRFAMREMEFANLKADLKIAKAVEKKDMEQKGNFISYRMRVYGVQEEAAAPDRGMM
ncbi:hypothetical protein PQX77_019918 [Marasmius sp. AFHP31]|nr:hypothetical protein PQX77_019918 [Marasmius sp. AFHP31]